MICNHGPNKSQLLKYKSTNYNGSSHSHRQSTQKSKFNKYSRDFDYLLVESKIDTTNYETRPGPDKPVKPGNTEKCSHAKLNESNLCLDGKYITPCECEEDVSIDNTVNESELFQETKVI